MATEARDKSLEYNPNGYELQMLEQSVTPLIPYSTIYRTTNNMEIFIEHYALSGIHYFKRIW